MGAAGRAAAELTGRTLVLTRVLDAPRALAFRAWTDPKHLAAWWGPKGFTNPVCEVDARPGGAIRIHMQAPDGAVYPMTGTFEEVVEPQRLVMRCAALNAAGEPILEVRTTVTFSEHDGCTMLTLRAEIVRATEEAVPHAAGMEEGWTQSLERLAETFVSRKRPTMANGKICYLEIPAEDIERSAGFYRAVFGWRTRCRGDGRLAFDDAVTQVSGTWVLGRPAAREPGILTYIMVDDAAATVEAIKANGGRVVQPIGADAPEITARFADPAGNVFGIYQQPAQAR